MDIPKKHIYYYAPIEDGSLLHYTPHSATFKEVRRIAHAFSKVAEDHFALVLPSTSTFTHKGLRNDLFVALTAEHFGCGHTFDPVDPSNAYFIHLCVKDLLEAVRNVPSVYTFKSLKKRLSILNDDASQYDDGSCTSDVRIFTSLTTKACFCV